MTSGSRPEAGAILHLIASGGVYGIERMLLGLLPALRRHTYPIALVCLNVRGTMAGRVGELARMADIPVDYAGFGNRFDPRILLRLRAVLVACRPRLLHVHGYKATIVGGSLGLARGVPVVATAHTEVRRTPGMRAYARLETRVLRRLRGIAAVSEAIRSELESRGVPPARIRVIPNGIADRAASQSQPPHGGDGPSLLYVGRLIREKNVHLLIGCLPRLRQEFPGLSVQIVGEGPARAELEQQASGSGLRDVVRFAGFVEDVYPFLVRSDCLVLPSQTEGMPIAILEAMCAGVPIVSTAVGSVPSMLRDGLDALLVESGDPDGLMTALRRVLGDAELRHRLATSARERFEDAYTADHMAGRYAGFYEECLADWGRA